VSVLHQQLFESHNQLPEILRFADFVSTQIEYLDRPNFINSIYHFNDAFVGNQAICQSKLSQLFDLDYLASEELAAFTPKFIFRQLENLQVGQMLFNTVKSQHCVSRLHAIVYEFNCSYDMGVPLDGF
jgi:hypothetical protein